MRIGVIGCGEIAEIHREALRRHGAGFCAAYDTAPRTLEAFCRKTGAASVLSAEELIGRADLDAVYICTRHDSHVALAVQALRASKRVFLEKPLALTAADGAAIAAVEHAGLRVGYNMRHSPSIRRLHDLLQEKNVTAESFEAHMICAPFFSGWAGDPLMGGGVLVCEGSHMFDLIEHTLGERITAVMAETRHVRTHGGKCADFAAILLRMNNGAIGTLMLHDQGDYLFHVEPGAKMVCLTVYSPQGTYQAEAYGNICYSDGKQFYTEDPAYGADRVRAWGYEEQAGAFLRGGMGLCGFDQALHVAQVADACGRSAAKHAWIQVGAE